MMTHSFRESDMNKFEDNIGLKWILVPVNQWAYIFHQNQMIEISYKLRLKFIHRINFEIIQPLTIQTRLK